MKIKHKIVLDTNIIISAYFGNENSPNAEIIKLRKDDKVIMLFSDDILDEYVEKLIDKKVPSKEIIEFVKDVSILGEYTKITFFHLQTYPADRDDIAFVLCADNGKDDYLISYDEHLLILNGVYDFKIYLPLEFLFAIRQS